MKAKCVMCGKEFEKQRASITCGEVCARENKRVNHRNWSDANPEKVGAYQRKRRDANPEKAREKSRKCYAANIGHYRKYYREKARQRRAANPAVDREYARKYYAVNPEQARDNARKHHGVRRAAKALGIPPILYAAMKLVERASQSQPPGETP